VPFFSLNKYVLSIHSKQIKLLILLGQYSAVASVAKRTVLAMMVLTKKHELGFGCKDRPVIFIETVQSALTKISVADVIKKRLNVMPVGNCQ